MKYLMLVLLVAKMATAVDLNIVGHRGSSHYAPENTMESILLAYDQGAMASECDIQLTKDKKIVLFHDESLLRIAGINSTIGELTYEQLKMVNVAEKDSPWRGARIPLLDDVVQKIPPEKLLFVEIKAGDLNQGVPQEFVNALIDFIEKTPVRILNKIVFISFNHEILQRLKFLFNNLMCMPLLAFRQADGDWPYVKTNKDIEGFMRMAQEHGFIGLFLEYGDYVTSSLVAQIQAHHLMVAVWNYQQDDTALVAKTMASYRVDFYNTNDVVGIKQALMACQNK